MRWPPLQVWSSASCQAKPSPVPAWTGEHDAPAAEKRPHREAEHAQHAAGSRERIAARRWANLLHCETA